MSVDHWQQELARRVAELKTNVTELKEMEDTSIRKRKQLDACSRRLQEVNEARKNCDRAVRILKDTSKRIAGKESLREIDKEIRYNQDEMRRVELGLNYSHAVNIDDKASDGEYKREIDRMQGGMKDSYDRQIRQLDRTLDVAFRAREGVEAQGQQVQDISSEAARIGDNLDGADDAVRRFKKQVSSDRICQGLLLLNILVLIGFSILVGFKWNVIKHAL